MGYPVIGIILFLGCSPILPALFACFAKASSVSKAKATQESKNWTVSNWILLVCFLAVILILSFAVTVLHENKRHREYSSDSESDTEDVRLLSDDRARKIAGNMSSVILSKYVKGQNKRQRPPQHQKQIMVHLLQRSDMQGLLASCDVLPENERQVISKMLDTVKQSLQHGVQAGGGGQNTHIKIARATCLAMMIGPWALADHLTSTVAKVLGVNRPRVTQAACQNALVNVGIDDTYLAKYRVRGKKNRIADEDLKKACQFWIKVANPSPNMYDQVYNRIKDDKGVVIRKELVQKMYVQDTAAHCYKRFKDEHPDVKMGLKKFIECRPIYVKTHVEEKNRVTCCCIRCINMEFMLRVIALHTDRFSWPENMESGTAMMVDNPSEATKDIFRDILKTRVEERERGSTRANPSGKSPSVNMYSVKTASLCPKPHVPTPILPQSSHPHSHPHSHPPGPQSHPLLNPLPPITKPSPFHDIKCLNGTCNSCGIQRMLPWALKSAKDDVEVKYKCFKKEVGHQNGQSKSYTDLHEVTCNLSDLRNKLHEEWPDFLSHETHRKWQKVAMDQCFERLKGNEIATNADFSEKFGMKYNYEIQSLYYITKSCSLFIIIGAYPRSWVDETARDDAPPVYETHAFWSDDKKQDVVFVDTAYRKFLANLRDRFPQASAGKLKWYQWTDNCASQFKCAAGFETRTRYDKELQVLVEQHMGCPGHGKGPWDGEGGQLKTAAARELVIEDGTHLSRAKDLVKFCNENLTLSNISDKSNRKIIARVFYEITTDELKAARRKHAGFVTPLNGSKSMYCFKFNGGSSISARVRSCFCDSCKYGEGTCPNESYTGSKWSQHDVVNVDSENARKRMEQDHGVAVCRQLKLRPNSHVFVAVRHNDLDFPDYQYFLLKVTANHTGKNQALKKSESDEYNVPFNAGSFVLKGHYLDKADDVVGLPAKLNGAPFSINKKLAIVSSQSVIMKVQLDRLERKQTKNSSNSSDDREIFCISEAQHDLIMQKIADLDDGDDDDDGHADGVVRADDDNVDDDGMV